LLHLRRDLRRLATTLLLLAVAGCAGAGDGGTPQAALTEAPPGFTANTFSRTGLISGATATEAGCRALPDGLWVGAGDGRHECLRYAAGAEQGAGRTALVYIPGDAAGVAYRFAGGRPQVDAASERYEASAETRRMAARRLAAAMGGTPVILIGRPGMHGSSGNHAQDRHSRAEVELVDAALTELRRRYGFRNFVLSGFSSGGVVAANLLARRSDIRCAVLASAPLDLAAFYQAQDGRLSDQYVMRRGELADPMQSLQAIRSDATIFVLGDRQDRKVPAATWEAWAAAARRAGLHVTAADTPGAAGVPSSRHEASSRSMEVARACATGETVTLDRASGAPAVRTSFAAPLLRAIE
jgi:pimeloyl-ACP methyl ester carboxylesterase